MCKRNFQVGATFIADRAKNPQVSIIISPTIFFRYKVVYLEANPTPRVERMWLASTPATDLACITVPGQYPSAFLLVNPPSYYGTGARLYEQVLTGL